MICKECGNEISEKFGCHPVRESYFSKIDDCDDNIIDHLIDYVTKQAFEGLDYTDPLSVEIAIREWFKSVKNEE